MEEIGVGNHKRLGVSFEADEVCYGFGFAFFVPNKALNKRYSTTTATTTLG